MSELLVYKASAGSGKTFTLAVEYIKLLIKNPSAYKNILAVTFTNKATGEMKERILSQLYGISKGDKDSQAYLNKICEELNMPPEEVRTKASESLSRLIHDYSRFQVNTIDSFFQTVMRSLARELGLGAGLNIELDTNSVLNEAIDRMVENLDIQAPVFINLLDYIKELIAEDKTWKVIDSIKEFGRNIFNEEFMEQRVSLHNKLKSPLFIPSYKKFLLQMQKEIEKPLQNIATEFFSILEQNCLSYTDLKGGSRGIGSYFLKLKNRTYGNEIRNKTVEKCLTDSKEWTTAKKSNATLSTEIASQLQQLLIYAEKIREKCNLIVNSCQLSLQHINKISLLANIDEEVHRLNEHSNRFLLAETNILLRELIQDEDSSFVFEKIGASIKHVMIDEFQDTSRLQWMNFKMLLLEGLSQGANSLIVGDVKQAIYRWRSGDWGILGGLKNKIGAFPIHEKSLAINRRSEQNVITFNNAFFTAATHILNELHKAEQNEDCTPLLDAYSDVKQGFPDEKPQERGYVKVSFVEGDEDTSYINATIESLATEVRELLDKGILLEDIVILVRKNKFIPLIADFFEANMPDCPIVSNEAFRLDASQALNTIIEAVRYLSNPDDKIALTHLVSLYSQFAKNSKPTLFDWDWNTLSVESLETYLPTEFIGNMENLQLLPLYELLEKLLVIFHLQEVPGQEAYFFAFFDAILDFLKKESSDLNSFLSYWDERLGAKTVPSGNIKGLRIYSIHNSKGLEFHTVLLPFCQWKMENEQVNQSVWCRPPVEPYNEMNILPINYGKKMDQSVYHDSYLKERLELWVDNLNILYVAFTRASKNLIIWGKKKATNTVSQLMQDSLSKLAPDFSIDSPYEYGTLCLSEKKRIKETSNLLVKTPEDLQVVFESYEQNIEFKQSNRSVDFIRGDEEPDQQDIYIREGKLLHRIFSAIHTVEDVDRVLQDMEMEGLFPSNLSENKIRTLVENALSNPKASNWFSNEWRLFNECAIIYKKNGSTYTRRPDRVMMHPDTNEVIVVDFKFGTPKPEYEEQVQEYMQLLQHMGYNSVSGYLWYVYMNNINEVK